jgi:hypothetical protein
VQTGSYPLLHTLETNGPQVVCQYVQYINSLLRFKSASHGKSRKERSALTRHALRSVRDHDPSRGHQLPVVEGDAKSPVTRTQGEADANRIRQNSLTPQLLELSRIENNCALIDKWTGQLPTVQTGQGSGMILQLPKPQ